MEIVLTLQSLMTQCQHTVFVELQYAYIESGLYLVTIMKV